MHTHLQKSVPIDSKTSQTRQRFGNFWRIWRNLAHDSLVLNELSCAKLIGVAPLRASNIWSAVSTKKSEKRDFSTARRDLPVRTLEFRNSLYFFMVRAKIKWGKPAVQAVLPGAEQRRDEW